MDNGGSVTNFHNFTEVLDIKLPADINPHTPSLNLEIIHRPPIAVATEACEEGLREAVDVIHAEKIAHAVSPSLIARLQEWQ